MLKMLRWFATRIGGRLARIYWNLLNYAIWRRIFVDGDDPQSLMDELQAS